MSHPYLQVSLYFSHRPGVWGPWLLWPDTACLARFRPGHKGERGKGLVLSGVSLGEFQDLFIGWQGPLGIASVSLKLPAFALCILGWEHGRRIRCP